MAPLFLGFGFGYALAGRSFNSGASSEMKERGALSSTSLKSLSIERALANEDPQEQLQWLAAHAEDEIHFQEALDNLIRQGVGKNDRAFHELVTLWANRDPLAALAYVLKLKGAVLSFALGSVIEGWAQKDYKSLAEWLQNGQDARSALLQDQAIVAIARFDPNLAFSLMDGKGVDRMTTMHWLFSSLIKIDPRAAILLMERTRPEERKTVIRNVVWEWAQSDPSAALSWAQGLPNDELRLEAIQVIAGKLAGKTPQDAAELIFNELSSGRAKSQAAIQSLVSSFLSTWASQDPAAARKWISTLPAEYRGLAMREYKQNLIYSNPKEYLKELERARTVSNYDRYSLQTTLSTMAETSPSEAVKWMRNNAEWLPKQMLANIVDSILMKAPDLSPQLLSMLAKSSLTVSVYETTGRYWTNKDPAEAVRFFSTLPSGEERDAFQTGMFRNMVSNNLTEAFQFLEAVPEGTFRSSLLRRLADETTQYQTTADWISSRFAGSSDTTKALSIVISQWANASPAEAATWLQKTPAGETKDQLVNSFSTAIVQRDPDMAIQWASAIDNETTRSKAMLNIARQWLHSDRKAARDWIMNAPFTAKEKASLLQ